MFKQGPDFLFKISGYSVLCSFPAGPNSFLVRPSDNSPGNFTLFFLCKQTVQRFKIEQQGSQLVMGGRYFEE